MKPKVVWQDGSYRVVKTDDGFYIVECVYKKDAMGNDAWVQAYSETVLAEVIKGMAKTIELAQSVGGFDDLQG
jgi:hypothetical protein